MPPHYLYRKSQIVYREYGVIATGDAVISISDDGLRRRPQGLLRRATAAGSDGFIGTRMRRRIAKQFFDADVEEPDGSSHVS